MRTDHSLLNEISSEEWISQYGAAVVNLHVQALIEETCHSVDSCLPIRLCEQVTTSHWYYFRAKHTIVT